LPQTAEKEDVEDDKFDDESLDKELIFLIPFFVASNAAAGNTEGEVSLYP
jgi:hypothetical protein